MSTVNGGCPESLEEASKRLSLYNSLPRRPKLVQIMGLKSESEIEMESEAKQKKIDNQVSLAEKVHGMLILLQNRIFVPIIGHGILKMP
jgi:hypothetical protein